MSSATMVARSDGPETAAAAEPVDEVALVGRYEAGRAFVEMRDREGTLLVEYEPATRRCRIHAEVVQLHAAADLELHAARRIQIEGAEGVVIRSGETAVELGPERVGFVAERIETQARRLVQRVGEIETHARQVIERAHVSFREVEDLAQTKAGRLRLVARDALRMLGRQAVVKAREDLKLRGERIYLE